MNITVLIDGISSRMQFVNDPLSDGKIKQLGVDRVKVFVHEGVESEFIEYNI